MNAFRALCVGIMLMACSAAGLEVGVGSDVQAVSALPRKLAQISAASAAKKSPPKSSPPKKSPPKSPPKKSPPKSPPKKSPPKKSPPKASPPKASPPKKSPPAGPAPGGAITIEVGPSGLSVFKPDSVKVAAGTKITFSLKSMGHNVVFTKVPAGVDKTKISDPGMSAPDVSPPYTFTATLTVAGVYEYVCLPHAGIGMVGTITVG